MKKALVAPLCLVLLTLGAPSALGGGPVEAKVTIKDSAPAFNGKVKSVEEDCAVNRLVELYRKRSGADKLLGEDSTNIGGEWKILEDQFALKSGAYYAKVPALNIISGASCQSDKSPTVVVD